MKDRENFHKQAVASNSRFISTKGKKFNMPDGSSLDVLEAVIVDTRNTNTYYKGVYNASNPKPPACFAIAREIDDLAPHADAPEKIHTNCADCPMNQWKSAPGGGNGKACKNTSRIAIVSPDGTSESKPLVLTASPTALKHWGKYLADMKKAGQHYVQVVTQISFKADEQYPVLMFSALRPSGDELTAIAWGLRDEAAKILDQPPIKQD